MSKKIKFVVRNAHEVRFVSLDYKFCHFDFEFT